MGKYVLLADCDPDSVQTLADGLKYNGHHFQVESYISNWKRTGIISELKRYGMYFTVGFRCLLKRREYAAIIGWQQFYALIFSFFCSVFQVKKSTMVVALNYTYKEKKGKAAAIYRWFMRKCMDQNYLDYIHVPSNEYADKIAKEFQFPRERIIVTGFGVDDCLEEYSRLPVPDGVQKEGYALAIGRSNRDYDFLIRAWTEIDYPLVIISDTYKGTSSSDRITVLRNVAGEESYPWIAHCGLMVIPIDDPLVCSGDTVLLTAMAARRRIIVTAPSTLAEMYISDGVNAVLTPKNEQEFCNTINAVLYSEQYKHIGDCARKSFLESYSRQSMGDSISRVINV